MEGHGHVGAGSQRDLWPYGKRSPHWSRFAGRTYDPMGDPHWSTEGLHPMEKTHFAAVHEELQPMGRIQTEEIQGRLSSMGGTLGWSMGRSHPPEEEEVAETMCDELIVIPIPISGHH